MSHVTAVVLVFSSDGRKEEDVLRDVNAYEEFARNGGLTDLTEHMGGTKHPQLDVAGGGFNYLDIDAFLAHLRGIDWGGGFSWADVAIQDEHNQGVGWIHVYRGPLADEVGSPWAEEKPPTAQEYL